jgi:hypothetical protein
MDSNFVNHFCWILADGGGVYTWKSGASGDAQQKQIIGNYIHNGGGPMCMSGVSLNYTPVYGVYLDEYSDQWLASYNTVDSVAGAALFDHGDSNTFVFNTGHGSGYAELLVQELSGGPVVKGVIAKHNTLSGAASGDAVVRLITTGTDLTTFGVFDSSYFNHSTTAASFYKQDNTGSLSMSLSTWQSTYSSFDQHSTFQQFPFTLIGVPGTVQRTVWLPGVYNTPSGAFYGSFVLPSYQGTLGYQLPIGIRIKISSVSSMGHP